MDKLAFDIFGYVYPDSKEIDEILLKFKISDAELECICSEYSGYVAFSYDSDNEVMALTEKGKAAYEKVLARSELQSAIETFKASEASDIELLKKEVVQVFNAVAAAIEKM